MTAGILILLKMSPFEFAENVGEIFRRKATIKQKIMAVQKPKKIRGIRRIVKESKLVLASTKQTDKFSTLCVIALTLALLGIVIAMCLDNVYLAPVLAIGFALIPFLYVIYSSARYRKQLNAELQSALSTITTSYQRNENLIAAVKENIGYLTPPLSDVFNRFLIRVESIDPDITAALESIKPEIDNNVWQEWVDSLILCQRNRTQISTLPFIVSKLSKIRKVTNDLEYEMFKPVKGYMAMRAIIAGMTVAFCCISSDWRSYLLASVAGKIALAVSALVVLVTLIRVITLTKPAEYKR